MEYDVTLGKISKPEVKRLAIQLEKLKSDNANISPQMDFKFTLDRFNQVHVKFNHRALLYIFWQLSTLIEEDLAGPVQEEPPAWFMELLGGGPDSAG